MNMKTIPSPKHCPLPSLPDICVTKPEVFIIESLYPEDEVQNRFEGRTLANLLRLSGKSPRYFYFHDNAELPYIIALFRQSQYRYLHFSCHGDATDVITRSGNIPYMEFSNLFKGHLQLRRVFFSACELGNELFTEVMGGNNKGMHSIVAPAERIFFAQAAAIYHTLYLSLFAKDKKNMSHHEIISKLKSITPLFPVSFHFSGFSPTSKKWNHQTIK